MIGKQSIHSQINDLEYKLQSMQNAANVHDISVKLQYLNRIKEGEMDYLGNEQINNYLRDVRIYVHKEKNK